MKREKNKLEFILQSGPVITIIINNLYSELKKLHGNFCVSFFDEEFDTDEDQASYWDIEEKIINLNPNLTNFQIINDLIAILCDAANCNHQFLNYESFENGEAYARKKIHIQYQSLIKSSEIIYRYITENTKEAKKIFQVDQEEIVNLINQLVEYYNMGFSEYLNTGTDINQHFINEWNEYSASLTGQSSSENGNDCSMEAWGT